MKKILIAAAFALVPLAAFGAVELAKEYRQWEYMSSIQVMEGKSVYIYKIDDPQYSNVKCYLSFFNYSNQYETDLSCMKR